MSTVERPTPKQAAQTAYVILRREPGDAHANGPWREDGPHQTARSAKQAIRQALELRNESGVQPFGTYLAIPARSWQPVTVTVQTQTVLKLQEA